MTLHLIPSEFPHIQGKFGILFYQCTIKFSHKIDAKVSKLQIFFNKNTTMPGRAESFTQRQFVL
jgi:hypothetical protein